MDSKGRNVIVCDNGTGVSCEFVVQLALFPLPADLGQGLAEASVY